MRDKHDALHDGLPLSERAGLGTMWGQQLARQLLAEAGFTVLDVMRIPGDDGNYYYLATRE